MKSIALVLVVTLLVGCTTTPQDHDNQTPVIKSYPQDIEQCNAQPEVIWCQTACKKDPEYEWCDVEE